MTDEKILDISARFIPNADKRARDSQVIDFARTILAENNDDSGRLEWMASHEAWVAWSKDGEVCRVFHRNDDGDIQPIMGWKCPWFDCARDAIDAAMQRTAAPAHGENDGRGES